MQRYFIDQTGLLVQALVTLTADDSRHFLRVMRSQPGAKAWLVTGDGQCYLAQLEGEVDRLAQFRLIELQEGAAQVELPVEVTIACGLSKNDKLDYIVQKATECGASHFQPLALSRDVVKWDHKKAGQRLDRLQKIAKEAAEQCHRLRIPQVAQSLSLAQLLAKSADYDACLVAYEEDAKQGEHSRLRQACQTLKGQAGAKVLVVFGSEGGLTPEEVSQLCEAGFQTVALGPRILRAETAPIYFLSALSYALELEL